MKLYKLKKESDYVTQGEDTEVEKHLNWWINKYTLIIEKHLIETMDLAQTLWIAFDKKQPTTEQVRQYLNEIRPFQFRKTKIEGIEKFKNSFETHDNWNFINNFMEQEQRIITIEMLVAMKDGKPMKDPELTMKQGDGQVYYGAEDQDFEDYKQAMESVLYEGFEVDNEAEDYGKILFKNFWDWFIDPENRIHLADMHGDYKIDISDMKNEPITLNWWKEVLR